MLDLNYVRGNLEEVRAALEARGFPVAALEDFAALDAERRRVIAESDALNAQRNASSRSRVAREAGRAKNTVVEA